MTDLGASPLGHATSYADEYDPGLLFPVDRAPQREELGLGAVLPFDGVDLWNAYELSWLLPSGKPQVAIATFAVPASSPRIVESKSVKLYLTAFNQSRFAAAATVADTLTRDLSAATGAPVAVTLTGPAGFGALPHAEPDGDCLDVLPVACERYLPDPDALQRAPGAAARTSVAETLFTRLFRSVCPVTGQPDYASVSIRYRGPALDRAGLLRYLVSYRRHPGFHEHCVERIFVDVWRRCQPEALAVGARFTRRGGVDINPWRSSGAGTPLPNCRTARQ
jgi:7-cyano-7-deazaguanine reductase